MRPKSCGGSSSGPRVVQSRACAHTRTKRREGGEGGRKRRGGDRRRSLQRAAAGGAGGGDGRASGPRIWAWPGTHVLESQKIDPLVVKRARRKTAWRRRGWLVIEPRSAVLARPQACVRDYGLARGVRVPVPSACLAPWGQKGLRAVAARLHVSSPSRDAAPSVLPGPTDLALCVAGPRSVV